MKISKVVTQILRIPEDDPLADMPEDGNRLRPIVTAADPDRRGASRASG